jgi:F-type H+-transporting ATPase subunit gamma
VSSLKEIKSRIGSVKSTQKITSAMKMVASANLRKAQYQIECFLPYQSKLNEMIRSFLASETDFTSDLSEAREVKRVALIVFSSNSGLCGAFNSNAIKLLSERIAQYKQLSPKDIEIYPIGKKVETQVRKMALPYPIKGSYIPLMDKPNFDGAKEISEMLLQDFLKKKIDRVELVYNHFKTTAVQVPTVEQFLPLVLKDEQLPTTTTQTDYIVEPNRATILQTLLPKSLNSKVYAVLCDSAAAEQAARMVAMQIATDNADEILDGLTIQYNKQRQQAITSELLDIIGGSEALK